MATTLESALEQAGSSLAELASCSREVVLFGSRATPYASAQSDWDVLCIGTGDSRRSPGLDLVVVHPDELEDWLDHELATHVATWGRWLHGAGEWRTRARISARTVHRKARWLAARSTALREVWPQLTTPQREAQARRLFANAQRLDLLRAGEAIPPGPLLDACWRRLHLPETTGVEDWVTPWLVNRAA